MKFIVIILAAGMVAFIGAVICIIAAVHTGSSKAAAAQQQPATDNHSLYPDAVAQTPAVGGSVARAGSLGALHGSETPDLARLICTPIPAGECNPKNFRQQSDDQSLYAGEDWGYLRTTAEELRQTVLQQKDQILSDQRTIRELTGKLSESEEGLRFGARMMVRDSPASAPDSGHYLTARAVDELEQAITQLKDRIEKLEVRRSGISDSPERLADHGHKSGADNPWRMEDLEGELERKLELLEKERKALRLETEKHKEKIDHGISMSQHLFPEGYRLSFPTRTNYMYAVMKHSVPKLRAFTVCLWLRSTDVGIGTPLSYAVPEQANEVVLMQGMHTPAELLVNDKVAQLPLNLSRGSWQHICVSWNHKGGAWQAYQGGKLRGEGHALATGHHVRPGGVLVLGQEQDSLGGGFDSSQAMVGELSQVGLWDRVLSSNQVASLSRCSKITQGSVFTWTENGVGVFGGATKEPGEPCSKHSRSSQ
uniref:Neuronal pentraxin-2-like n=1 Tax=Cynoglossus semilaevis TaxID=244447 RepID=A0A3P8WPQ3_CYNSE